MYFAESNQIKHLVYLPAGKLIVFKHMENARMWLVEIETIYICISLDFIILVHFLTFSIKILAIFEVLIFDLSLPFSNPKRPYYKFNNYQVNNNLNKWMDDVVWFNILKVPSRYYAEGMHANFKENLI